MTTTVWLLVLFWVALCSFIAGNALAGAGDCAAGWVWNPVNYMRLLSQVQASPWAWTAPQMSALFKEARIEIFGAIAAVAGSTAAFCVGGPTAAQTTITILASLTGASVPRNLAHATANTIADVPMGKMVDQQYQHRVQLTTTSTEQQGAVAFSGKGNRLDQYKKMYQRAASRPLSCDVRGSMLRVARCDSDPMPNGQPSGAEGPEGIGVIPFCHLKHGKRGLYRSFSQLALRRYWPWLCPAFLSS